MNATLCFLVFGHEGENVGTRSAPPPLPPRGFKKTASHVVTRDKDVEEDGVQDGHEGEAPSDAVNRVVRNVEEPVGNRRARSRQLPCRRRLPPARSRSALVDDVAEQKEVGEFPVERVTGTCQSCTSERDSGAQVGGRTRSRGRIRTG